MSSEPNPASPALRADAESNRLRIIAAAQQVFGEQGVAAPLTEVADRAGVGIATLYRRFPTRQALVEEAFEDAFARYDASADMALAEADPWDAFAGLVERMGALQAENRGFTHLVQSSVPLGHRRDGRRERTYRKTVEVLDRATFCWGDPRGHHPGGPTGPVVRSRRHPRGDSRRPARCLASPSGLVPRGMPTVACCSAAARALSTNTPAGNAPRRASTPTALIVRTPQTTRIAVLRWGMAHSRRLALAALMASVLGLAGLAGCSRERVPLPAADASPQDVIGAYIKAINAKDCDSLEALSDPGNSVNPWCSGITVTDVTLGAAAPDTCCGPGNEHAHVINVAATIHTRDGDSSMPDGEHAWGYLLVRDHDTDRWRVGDQGAG